MVDDKAVSSVVYLLIKEHKLSLPPACPFRFPILRCVGYDHGYGYGYQIVEGLYILIFYVVIGGTFAHDGCTHHQKNSRAANFQGCRLLT